MKSTLTAVQLSTARRRTFLWSWLIWTAGFLAFPIAGVAGRTVAGRVDSPTAALAAGFVTGGVIGTGQWLVSRGRLRPLPWIVATALGMGLGLLLGATVVGFRTSLADLAVMGALTGAVLGVAQTLALPVKHGDAGGGPPRCRYSGRSAGSSPHSPGSPLTSSSPYSAPAEPSPSPRSPGCCCTGSLPVRLAAAGTARVDPAAVGNR